MNRQPMPPRRVALARGATPLRRTPVTRRRQARQPAQGPRPARKATAWTADTRETVKARSGGRCEIGAVGCLVTATNIHHRLPTRMGGSSNPALSSAANALHVCGMGNASGCHLFVDEFSTIAQWAGWKLPAGADPASVPVRYRCKTWRWLTEDGKTVGEVAA